MYSCNQTISFFCIPWIADTSISSDEHFYTELLDQNFRNRII